MKLIYLISRVFFGLEFLNFLAHSVLEEVASFEEVGESGVGAVEEVGAEVLPPDQRLSIAGD